MGYAFLPQDVEMLAASAFARREEYVKGQRIFTKKPSENFSALVTEGLVYLCAEDEDYCRSILRFFRPGDVFHGEMLLPLRHGVCYLMAKYPTRALVFSHQAALRACAGSTETLGRLARAVSRQEGESLSYAYLLQQRSPRQRLLTFFRMEARRQGSLSLTLPLPLSDLADYLAVDRASMMRELTRMKEEGLVAGQRREWTLLQQSV